MLHGTNNENILHMKELLFPWEKESFVPAMQHGCRAKPLLFPKPRTMVEIHFFVSLFLALCQRGRSKNRAAEEKTSGYLFT